MEVEFRKIKQKTIVTTNVATDLDSKINEFFEDNEEYVLLNIEYKVIECAAIMYKYCFILYSEK